MLMRGISRMMWRDLYGEKFALVAECDIRAVTFIPSLNKNGKKQRLDNYGTPILTASDQKAQRKLVRELLGSMLNKHRCKGLLFVAMGILLNVVWAGALFIIPRRIRYKPWA